MVPRLVALAALVLGLMVAPPTPTAQAVDGVRTERRCNPDRYDNHYAVITRDKRAKVTHLRAHSMPPYSSRRVTKRTFKVLRLSARVSFNSETEVGASGAAKVIAKASSKTSLSLASRGSTTRSTAVKVTETIRNPTAHNAQFVFFRGNMTAKGAFRYWFCSLYYTPTGDVGYFVYYRTGRWKSFAVYSDGAARCGAGGSVNAVTRAALAQGC